MSSAMSGGGHKYSNPSTAVALRPSGAVTTTSTNPRGFGGVVTVIVPASSSTETTTPASPPNVTTMPTTKFSPVITTVVPPSRPASAWIDAELPPTPAREVQTRIEIDAPPEVVWHWLP